MAPHSRTLAWKIPWTEEPGGLQSMGSLESDATERLHFHFSLSCIGEGQGNPLQCSGLENPRDGGAWWAAIYGVAQSWTWLKWLSSSSNMPIKHESNVFHSLSWLRYLLSPHAGVVFSQSELKPLPWIQALLLIDRPIVLGLVLKTVPFFKF